MSNCRTTPTQSDLSTRNRNLHATKTERPLFPLNFSYREISFPYFLSLSNKGVKLIGLAQLNNFPDLNLHFNFARTNTRSIQPTVQQAGQLPNRPGPWLTVWTLFQISLEMQT